MGLRGIAFSLCFSVLLFLGTALTVLLGATFLEMSPSVRDVRLLVLDNGAKIHVGAYQGSGLAIGDGLVLTAAHLLHGEPPIVEFPGGTPCEAEVVACDDDEDLALLFVPGLDGLVAHWAEPRLLDEVFVAGCPRGRDRICMPGEIMSLDDDLDGHAYHCNSSPMTFGSSGGIVFEVRGGRPILLGIVSRMDTQWQHVQWFVPAWRVRAFLGTQGVEIP